MTCPYINAFFSCSFQDIDKEVNDFFRTICEALNINSKNVSDGYSATPPEVARKMIEESKVVVAIIPRRHDLGGGFWTMPSAVHEEITMAFALKKPTLLMVEEGVKVDGFVSNLGTFKSFNRSDLYTNEFIKSTIGSIHGLRMEAVEHNNLLPDQDAAGFFAESITYLIELTKESGEPLWRYNSSRKLVFSRPFQGQIKNSAWVEHLPEGSTKTIQHKLSFTSNRTDIVINEQTIKDTPQQLEIGLSFDKPLSANDWVNIDFSYSSPHLNAITKSEVTEGKRPYIGGQLFDCFDGIIPIQPTKELHAQLRFPEWYGIDPESIFPFVGSYSSSVDYIADAEIRRAKIDSSKFGGTKVFDIRVENPLMRHVYGIAWNLK